MSIENERSGFRADLRASREGARRCASSSGLVFLTATERTTVPPNNRPNPGTESEETKS